MSISYYEGLSGAALEQAWDDLEAAIDHANSDGRIAISLERNRGYSDWHLSMLGVGVVTVERDIDSPEQGIDIVGSFVSNYEEKYGC